MDTVTKVTGQPRKEFLLIPFGPVDTDRALAGGDFNFTREHAEQALAAFERLGRSLVIDYEHQTIARFNTRPDQLAPAAGWIGGLQIRADGLWATDVKWTDAAETMLSRGEYRYFSPVIWWGGAKKDRVESLGPVALTNDPAMLGVEPLVATRAVRQFVLGDMDLKGDVVDPGGGKPVQQDPGPQPTETKRPRGATEQGAKTMESIARALGLDPGATEEEILAAIAKLREGGTAAGAATVAKIAAGLGVKADSADTLLTALKARGDEATALSGRVAALEKANAELAEKAARAEFDQLCSSEEHFGKIPPAKADTFFGVFKRDRKEFGEILGTLTRQVGRTSELQGHAGGSGGAASGQHPYEQKIAETVLARKCTRLEAIHIVQAEDPDLYEKFRKDRKAGDRH